jgi:hypothetical protein
MLLSSFECNMTLDKKWFFKIWEELPELYFVKKECATELVS